MASEFQAGNMAAARERWQSAMKELEIFVNAATVSSKDLRERNLQIEDKTTLVYTQLSSVISRLHLVLDE